MFIINADDFGINRLATNNILTCYVEDRITSASAMVFMSDSERAAELAISHGFNVGLHINFSLQFDACSKSNAVIERQQRIVSFLRKNKYASLFYNPFLKNDFEYVYRAQYEEYVRLYGKHPLHIDGHHHMHLCMNMLIDRLMPKGYKVRKSFDFFAGEKHIVNRYYRKIIDSIVSGRYTCVDYFFNFSPDQNTERLRKIVNLAQSWNVELMVHPEKTEEFIFLMSDKYVAILSDVKRGNYAMLEQSIKKVTK